MFSRACEYAIRAIIYVATQSLQGKRVSLKEIASAIESPEAFTAKILQILARNDSISSVKGNMGGYEMSLEQMKGVKLHQIVFAFDGDAIYQGCALGLSQCNASKPCPLHERFLGIRNELSIMLQTTSIYDLATGLRAGLTFLKR